jgi:hypothetical protein
MCHCGRQGVDMDGCPNCSGSVHDSYDQDYDYRYHHYKKNTGCLVLLIGLLSIGQTLWPFS